MRNIQRTLVTLALLVPACSDGGEPDANTTRGWRATSLAIGDQQADWGNAVDAEGNLALDWSCTDGGGATIEGSYAGEDDFSVSISFEGCKADGVVISGSLEMQASVEVSEGYTHVELDYGGTLTWSGAAQGSCSIDMNAEVTTRTSEDEIDVDIAFAGSVCGYDAEAVVSSSLESE
jgi:hypothetical protein